MKKLLLVFVVILTMLIFENASISYDMSRINEEVLVDITETENILGESVLFASKTKNQSNELSELGFSQEEIDGLSEEQKEKLEKYQKIESTNFSDYFKYEKVKNENGLDELQKTQVSKDEAEFESKKINEEKTEKEKKKDSSSSTLKSGISTIKLSTLTNTTCDETYPENECTTDDSVSESLIDSNISYVRITVTIVALNLYEQRDSNNDVIQGNFFVKTTIDWLTQPSLQYIDVIGISASEYTKIVPDSYFGMQTMTTNGSSVEPGAELRDPDVVYARYDPDNISYFDTDMSFGGGVALKYNMINSPTNYYWNHRISVWAETYYNDPSKSINDDNDITVTGGFVHQTFGFDNMVSFGISYPWGISIGAGFGSFYDDPIELNATLNQADISYNSLFEYERPSNWSNFSDPVVTIVNSEGAWITYDCYMNLKALGFLDYEIESLTETEIFRYSQYIVRKENGVYRSNTSNEKITAEKYLITTVSLLENDQLYVKQNMFWKDDQPTYRSFDLLGIKYPSGVTFDDFYAKQVNYNVDHVHITNYSYNTTASTYYTVNQYGFVMKMDLFNSDSTFRDHLFLTTNIILDISDVTNFSSYTVTSYYRHATSNVPNLDSDDFYIDRVTGITLRNGYEDDYDEQISNTSSISNPDYVYVPSC